MEALKILEMADPDDLRNEINQLRAELDALKQAFLDVTRLSEITADMGDQRGGRFATQNLVLDDENGHSGTGTLLDDDGLHGYNTGKIQFELTSLDGKAKFARGSAIAGKDGLLMTTGNPLVLDDGNDLASFGILPGFGGEMLSAIGYAEKSLTNPGFETGDLTGWTPTGSPAASNTQAQDGTYSCNILNAVIATSSFITTTKRGFVIDFWAYSEGGLPQITVSIDEYDAGSVLVGTDGNSFYVNTTGVWQRYMIPIRSSVSPVQAKIKLKITSTGTQPLYVDQIRLYDTTRLMALFHDTGNNNVRLMTQDAIKDFFPFITSGDASEPAGMLFGNGNNGTIAAATTNFLGAGKTGLSAAEADAGIQVTTACTLKKLYVRTRSAQPGTGNLVFTVQVNGVDTGITVTIAAGAAAVLSSDLTNVAAISSGQRVTLKAVNNASGASAQIVGWSIGMFV